MKNYKRITACLLSVLMVLSCFTALIPMTAFAEAGKTAFDVAVSMPEYYTRGETLEVNLRLEKITVESLSAVSFDIFYDTARLKLINTINSDNTIDCVTKLPGAKWENLTILDGDVPGKIVVAVVLADTDVFPKNDGDIALNFRFEVLDPASGNVEISVPSAGITGYGWDDPSKELNGNGASASSAYHEHKYVIEKCDSDQHKRVCICGKIIYEKHTFENTVTAPTCEEKGYTTHTCKLCGESYVDSYTDALGHKPGDWVIVKEAANGEDGLKEKYCTVCGKTVESAVIPSYIKGDANGDGKINAVDYALAKRHVLKTWKLEGVNFKAADLNGDGKITANEYALIKRHVLKTYVIPQD